MRLLLVLVLAPALALCAPQQQGASLVVVSGPQDGALDDSTPVPGIIRKVHFRCEFYPKMTFFPQGAGKASFPVYSCRSGGTVIWLASEDFRSQENETEWVERAFIELFEEDVFSWKKSLGAWRRVEDSPFRASPGLELNISDVAITGLRLSQSPLAVVVPGPMPMVGFSNIFDWVLSKLPF